MFDFLRAIHLQPIEWSEAIKSTGKASPYIGEVLNAAFRDAQAVVALLTPDDVAKLRPDLVGKDDPEYEKALTGQTRANVLFEAGMAFASHQDKTVLVQIGRVRPFSDVAGRHVVLMDGSVAKRKDLAQRLQGAGCSVDLQGEDWLTTGDLTPPPEDTRGATVPSEPRTNSDVDAETYQLAVERVEQLKEPAQKEALRLLMREDLTDAQALNFLHQKGLAMNWAQVYEGIARDTNLAQRALPGRQPDEHVYGYTGPWTINPKFKSALQRVFDSQTLV